MPITKHCLVCDSEFKVRPSHADRYKTCSNECKGKLQTTRVTLKCQHCGDKFEVTKSKQGQKFCSNQCMGKAMWGKNNPLWSRKEVECKHCGKTFFTKKKDLSAKFCSQPCYWEYAVGEKSHHWKGGRIVKRDGYAYIRIHKTYYPEHVWVMEKHLGRFLNPPEEEVHHINGVKTDNRLENLKLMSRSEHRRIHASKS